jgi:thymidylate synthase ThyX
MVLPQSTTTEIYWQCRLMVFVNCLTVILELGVSGFPSYGLRFIVYDSSQIPAICKTLGRVEIFRSVEHGEAWS